MSNYATSFSVTFSFIPPYWCREHIKSFSDVDLAVRVDDMCQIIRRMWQEERNEINNPDAGLIANDRLRERVYFMMFWLRHVDLIDEARAHMRRSGRRGRRPKSDDASAFVDVLHYIFRDADTDCAGVVFSKTRPRIARELAYAFQHNIPPVLLLPFLRHTTQVEVLRRQKLGVVEDWLSIETST